VQALVVNSGNYIFAGTYSGGIFRSSSNGSSWLAINNGLTDLHIQALAARGNIVFAATDGAGVFKSTDNGASWISVSNGLTNEYVEALAVTPTYIFAGTFGSGIFVSSDNGANWNEANSGLTYGDVLSFAVSGNNVFAGIEVGGVCVTTNNGSNWQTVNDGLNDPFIYSFAVAGPYLFAGSYDSSVWRRPISEMLGVRNISTDIPGNYSLSQNYPNPFNPSTNIKFSLPKKIFVNLMVYNSLGQIVERLVNSELAAGECKVDWNAANYCSGVYFYELQAGDFFETRKMVLIK